jgi:hypothetical protein
MKAIARKDLVVGVEYTLDGSRMNKAHYVGKNEPNDEVFFISSKRTAYFEDEDGFIPFTLTGDPFFLEEDI